MRIPHSIPILIWSCILSCVSYSQSSSEQKERIIYDIREQSDSIIEFKDNAGENARKWLNNFNAGLSLLGNTASADLGVTVRTFEIFLYTKKDSVTIKLEDGTTVKKLRERDKNLNISFLNRAAINFDSLKFMANTYILSLNPSPATFRISHSFFLTKNNKIEIGKKSTPVVSLQFLVDGRVVPFATPFGSVDVGGSFNAFGTLQCLFKSYERTEGEIKDEGMFYFEPSFYFITCTSSLMESIRPNSSTNYVLGLDFKVGYKSDKKPLNDIGLSGYYTWEKVVGPTFRVGLIVKPN